jgi:site-specific DNA-methyltransferase (adenine-specific)
MLNEWTNKLYFGDNLDILRNHIGDESVDLIYLDPPFNSEATYNVLFQEKTGEKSAAQITAFEDTWHWGSESEEAYHDLVTQGPEPLVTLMQTLRAFLGSNDMMAYLTMMAPRLVELHRVLKPTGTIYLHCDEVVSHYLKLVMDASFSPERFLNEITWKRTHSHGNVGRNFGAICDKILVYTKTKTYTWNQQYTQFDQQYIEEAFKYRDPDGRRWQSVTLRNPGVRPNLHYPFTASNRITYQPHPNGWSCDLTRMQKYDREKRLHFPAKATGALRLKMYLDESPGIKLQNLWSDIPALGSQAAERLGYPTQKPEALLERIIKTSSNEGDVVLDSFCGCGTSISVAERVHRRWIGIDITHLAISLMRHRLNDAFGAELVKYEVIGDPKDLSSAVALAHEDRYQFQWWALGLVDARPVHYKKGADHGIDGVIHFFDDNSNRAKKAVVQVKSGHVKVGDVRDLKGVMEREKAEIGFFITLENPTAPMIKEAGAAGLYIPKHFPDYKFPKMQILTIEELLKGKQAQYPRMNVATFKRAERQRKDSQTQKDLFAKDRSD